MHDKGMEIASHSYYHSSLPSADLEVDLKKSREVLEEATGAEVRFLCYPYGEYDERVISKAQRIRLPDGGDHQIRHCSAASGPFRTEEAAHQLR